jgi:microcystin-dependent protein
MAEPFLGEIRTFGFNFAPQGWALCNGQTLSIAQNTALFSLLGTNYGGNGTTTFQLPNLQGQCAVCMDSSYALGTSGGTATVTLTTAELPAHTHSAAGSSSLGNLATPVNSYPAASTVDPYVSAVAGPVSMASSATGGGGAHANQSPYLVVTFCIALVGVFPTRN